MPRQAILFLIDTQGTNCVGTYAGNPKLGTPNIDKLAAEGMKFDRAYTCSPVCGPARSAIFTALYPHSNGVLGNSDAPHLDIPTIGQRLQREKIATGYIGKWHLDGTDYFGDGRCPPGWDPRFWFDGRNYLDSLANDEERSLSRKMLDAKQVAEHGITAEFTHAHRTAAKAREFILRHKHDDFFLVVSIDEPHHPYICPEPFVSGFDDFLFPVPNAEDSLENKPQKHREWAGYAGKNPNLVKKDGKTALRNPGYFACNSFCDHEVGRVISAIDAETPGALVIYTSDHGDMFSSHGISGKGPVMYEEITHVPLIVRWPGVTPPGSVAASPVSHIDLVPTVIDFFGIAIPPLLQGTSLLKQFKKPGRILKDAIFIEFNRFEVDHDGYGAFSPIRCIFDGRHKLVINLLDTDELYDLETDPHELRNLINDPVTFKIRDHLHHRLIDWMGRTRDPLRCTEWSLRAWGGWRESSWGGPTRPRPFDESWSPKTLLYDTAEIADRPLYDKH